MLIEFAFVYSLRGFLDFYHRWGDIATGKAQVCSTMIKAAGKLPAALPGIVLCLACQIAVLDAVGSLCIFAQAAFEVRFII